MADPAVEAAERAEKSLDGRRAWIPTDQLLAVGAREMAAPIRELHRPVSRVFSWSAGLRTYEVCPTCRDKAGVHECGCWRDEDERHLCACSPLHGGRVYWRDCPTAQAVYTTEELNR